MYTPRYITKGQEEWKKRYERFVRELPRAVASVSENFRGWVTDSLMDKYGITKNDILEMRRLGVIE